MAIRIIEELGGQAIAVYHDAVALRALTKPHFFTEPKYSRVMPCFKPPSNTKTLMYYASEEHRGYLAPRLLKIFQAIPGYSQQYLVKKSGLPQATPLTSITHATLLENCQRHLKALEALPK